MKIIRSHLGPLVALLVLLALTFGSAYVRLGPANLILNLVISTAKMAVVALFFMELAKPGILFRLAAFAGLMWLTVYFMLILADYLTRFPGLLLD